MNETQGIKLVIMGMENAGKSTIVDIITKKIDENIQNPPIMNPTRGVSRSSLTLSEKNIAIWDFGGQEVYRNEYLASPEQFFHSISYFFYVLDVQDLYRVFSARMYFMAIYQLIKKHSPDAKLVLLFHKMDPNYDTSKRDLKAEFLEKIEPFLSVHNANYSVYDTTIHDINSIITAFSQEI